MSHITGQEVDVVSPTQDQDALADAEEELEVLRVKVDDLSQEVTLASYIGV